MASTLANVAKAALASVPQQAKVAVPTVMTQKRCCEYKKVHCPIVGSMKVLGNNA